MVKKENLQIAGFTSLSSADWQGKLVATIFLQGCPFNCVYCHNWQMIPFEKKSNSRNSKELEHPEDYKDFYNQVVPFLQNRKGLLDGVVFSGGEPTAQVELYNAVKTIKNMGFLVGIHTQGAYPDNLQKLLPYLDWIGFDIKAPPQDLEKIIRVNGFREKIQKSLIAIEKSKVDYELRTTAGFGSISPEKIQEIKKWLKSLKINSKLEIQQVRTDGTRDDFIQSFKEKKYLC